MAGKLDSAILGEQSLSSADQGAVTGMPTGAAGLPNSGPLGSMLDANQDVSTMSFEQAREELAQVVSRLEVGGEPLEAALALWERGEVLAAHCQVWLDGARQRLESITGDGATSTGSPFDPEPF